MTTPQAPQASPDPVVHPATRLGQSMRALHRHISSLVMKGVQEELQDGELTFSQMAALHQLRALAPMSVSRLASLTGLSLPAASQLADRLVVRGYAQRRENPEDRRAKLLDLTSQGDEVLLGMDRRFISAYQTVFEQADPQTTQAAAEALEQLLTQLRPLITCRPPTTDAPTPPLTDPEPSAAVTPPTVQEST